MNARILRRAALLLGIVTPAWLMAQAPAPSAITPENAPAARARAKELRDTAQKRFAADKADCNTRVMAIGCLSAAQERRAESVREAEALQKEAARVEREARQAKVTDKEARRAAEEPADRARDQAAVTRFRESEAQRAAERERRAAEERGTLESRRAQVAAEQAAKQRKAEEHRREDAARAAGAPERARKRAERERKYAERAVKIDERKRDYARTLKRREADKAAAEAKAEPPAVKK